MLDTETVCSVGGSSSESGSGPPSLQHEFDNIQTMERSAGTDSVRHINQATSPQIEQPPPVSTASTGNVGGGGGSSGGPSEPVTPTHAPIQAHAGMGRFYCADVICWECSTCK